MAIRLLAIDGFNLIRRIYEARKPATFADLQGVIDASTASIRRVISRHEPSHATLVLEGHDKTWRHMLEPQYKANRGETPPLLLENLELFREAFQQMGVTACQVENYEADDVVATIACVVEQHGGDTVIVSTDKIYLQLLSSHIRVFDHFSESFTDAGQVQKKYGVRVNQLVDYFALVGDRTNNIKGVPGIGPKAAQRLLGDYERLDEILAAANINTEARDAALDKITGNAEVALRCRQLGELKRDVALGVNLRSFRL